MKDQLEKLKKEVLQKLNAVKDIKVLRDLEIQILGRKGELTTVLRQLSDLSIEQRKNIGSAANDLKMELAEKFRQAAEKLDSEKKNDFVDLTLPGVGIKCGHLHPLTMIQNELEDIFSSLGFMILEGPELESDYFNFEALNITKHHPARDMQDTFYVNQKNKAGEYDLVMRTHTSPVQVRAMQKYGAPLRCVVPGRCFRSEATDVRHEHTLNQIEGLMIDKDISWADMKGVMEVVVQRLFGPKTKLRMRPKFYPFVEPGNNGEITCFICKGAGCRVCKQSGWLEIVGSGMVHPNVLRAGGVDPKIYQGFAFGFGLDRLTMQKYNISDVRLLNGGDLRFLEQF
jgi:phenylalanyl-tRNA synthetase alpha chain